MNANIFIRLLKIHNQCIQQILNQGPDAKIILKLKGKWGKRNTRRLCKGGPKGNIVSELKDGTIAVMFSAAEIRNYIVDIKETEKGARDE